MFKGKALKNIILFICTVLAALSCSLFCSAEGEVAMPKEFESVRDSLPNEALDALPDGIFSNDAEEFGEAVGKMSQAEYMLSYIGNIASLGLKDALKLLVAIVGILVLSSLFSALRSSFFSETFPAFHCTYTCRIFVHFYSFSDVNF